MCAVKREMLTVLGGALRAAPLRRPLPDETSENVAHMRRVFAERPWSLVMIIIAGFTLTDADKRDTAVRAHMEMVERARKCDGCLDLSISADPLDPECINIFERWRDQNALDAWRKVASPPSVVRRETYVKLYRTDVAPWEIPSRSSRSQLGSSSKGTPSD